MCALRLEELTDEERASWEALSNEDYEGSEYAALMDKDAFEVIQSVYSAALDDDFDWMLRLVVINGTVVARNKSNAAFCALLKRAYEHAVASGNAGACCNLANMYHNTDGTGSKEDYATAIELYELGADRGDDQSSVNLGYIYYYGRGVDKDYAAAYECYARAALTNGNPEAFWKLGDLYAGGRGVRQSDWMAWTMYLKAYENGKGTGFQCRAAHHVADYLMTGIEGKLDPDPDRALELYVKAEVSYYDAIDSGLTYYSRCLDQAIEGQAKAREAIREKHRRIRAGEE